MTASSILLEKAELKQSLLHEDYRDEEEGQASVKSVLKSCQHKANDLLWSLSHGGLLAPIRKLRRLPYAFTPSLIRHLLLNEDLALPQVGPTTWMDGFRGWAAVIVFTYHYFTAFTGGTHIGYGAEPVFNNILELPFFRVLYDGAVCVNIFFVVAGYVCSTKALQLMTKGNQPEKLIKTISGSVFRRFFRLYLPTMAVSFMTAMCAYAGFFEILRPMFAEQKKYFPGAFSEKHLKRFPTVYSQTRFWASEIQTLGAVFREPPFYPDHDPHLWTIQYEFRMSMHLYIVLFGLAKCRPWVRLGWLVTIALIYLGWNRWEGPLFFLGAAMAQYDILRTAQTSTDLLEHGQPHEKAPRVNQQRPYRRVIRWVGYVLALYLMSYPISNDKKPAPGFELIRSLIPKFYSRKEKFPKSIGVLIMFYLLATTPRHISSPQPSIWHRFLTCAPARYFAKNMFAIYLVHGPLLHIIGYGFPHWFWRFFPKNTVLGYDVGIGLGFICAFAMSVCAADIFTREIDSRCAALVRWMEQKCFVDN